MTREEAERVKYGDWDKVCGVIDEWITASEKELRNITSERLAIVQERIRTLEKVKGLPDQVIEFHSPLK